MLSTELKAKEKMLGWPRSMIMKGGCSAFWKRLQQRPLVMAENDHSYETGARK